MLFGSTEINSALQRILKLSPAAQIVVFLLLCSYLYIVLRFLVLVLLFVLTILRRLVIGIIISPLARFKTARSAIDDDVAAAPSQGGANGAPKTGGQSLKSLKRAAEKAKRGGPGADTHASSELFLTGLKGHTDAVTGIGFSKDGQLLATACEDRTVRVYNVTDGISPQKPGTAYRQYPMRYGVVDIAFCDESHVAILTQGLAKTAGLALVDISQRESLTVTHCEGIFKGRATAGLALKASYSSGALSGGPIIAAAAPTPEIKIYSGLSGLPQLGSIDTGGIQQYAISLTEDGRFVAAATFTSDVKIYEILYDRTGSFVAIKKAMDLKGHKRKVTAIDFSPDGSKAVTASEDGTLRIWNINVRYNMQEDPKQLLVVGSPLPASQVISRLAWGRSGHIVALSSKDIYILDSRSGSVVETIFGAHSGVINDVCWCPRKVQGAQGLMHVFATAGADGKVRLWRAPWPLA